MKIITYLFLTAALCAFLGCSANTETSNAPAVNSDGQTTGENAANSADSQQQQQQSAGAQTDLGKASPDALVKELYKLHENEKGPFFEGKNRAQINKFFDKTLADFIWNDLNGSEEARILSFDALYNAQDFEIKNFAVGEPKISGEKADVEAAFSNFGEKQRVDFALVKSGDDAWKISDIKYNGGKNSLLTYFKGDAKNRAENDSSSSEEDFFEGTYRVGDATCTVKPVKMAFEVKWAKGSGAMMFFYDSEAAQDFTYVSEDKGQGRDKFVFDDDTFTSGKFIRADGREMPVRKIK